MAAEVRKVLQWKGVCARCFLRKAVLCGCGYGGNAEMHLIIARSHFSSNEKRGHPEERGAIHPPDGWAARAHDAFVSPFPTFPVLPSQRERGISANFSLANLIGN